MIQRKSVSELGFSFNLLNQAMRTEFEVAVLLA